MQNYSLCTKINSSFNDEYSIRPFAGYVDVKQKENFIDLKIKREKEKVYYNQQAVEDNQQIKLYRQQMVNILFDDNSKYVKCVLFYGFIEFNLNETIEYNQIKEILDNYFAQETTLRLKLNYKRRSDEDRRKKKQLNMPK